ncbi:MAG: T9SS type A sorting domain-containing protein, partial [Bacteroidetes bacterium]|nr:T9SS type A sorting domain-containing protein [Bacteroidota bacterium]
STGGNPAVTLAISPNPNPGTFRLTFPVPTLGDVQIEVVNMVGQRIYTRSYSNFIGTYDQTIRLGHPASGVYLLVVYENGSRTVKKLIVK